MEAILPVRPLPAPPASTHLPRILLCLGALLLLASHAHAQSGVAAAQQALLQGRLNDAIPSLEQILAHQSSPAAELLLCRALFAEQQFDDALPHCQAAADAPSPTSDAFLWLGRVEGNRARRANPLSAFGIARKVKAAFSRAVQLNPSNDAAVDDLGQFLVEAPAVVGGGLDQAHALALQSMATLPVSAHRILAMIAVKNKDSSSAESELRAAVAAAHGTALAGAQVELARFLQHHDQPSAALAAAHAALAADHPASSITVDVARLLLSLHQPPEQVIPLLGSYLASPARSDLAPAFRVHLLLARLLADRGDAAGAAREQAEAHRLAPDAHLGPVPSADSNRGNTPDADDDPAQVP